MSEIKDDDEQMNMGLPRDWGGALVGCGASTVALNIGVRIHRQSVVLLTCLPQARQK